MLADIGFSVGADQKAAFKDVEVRHRRSPSNTLFYEDLTADTYRGIYAEAVNDTNSGLTVANGEYVLDGGSDGAFIVADPSRNAMPMLRTEFATSDKEIERARLYATARGNYDLYMNGERVSEDYFNPGFTQYNKTHLYQTYDVTDLISRGDNAIGAMMGEGWWSGHHNLGSWNQFGDRQSLLAKLVITYTDGTTEVVTTNPDTWKYYDDGPVRYGSHFMGEVYDATKEAEIEGWATAEYDDNSWKNAVEVPLDDTTTWDGYDYDDMQLIGDIAENVSKVKTLTAQDVTEVRPGVYVYDMGQNMVGVPRIEISDSTAGDKITLRVAEMLYPDHLPQYEDNAGMIMIENLRAALSQDIYITRDGDQTIEPRFTFHGYRYIEITGIDEALPLDAVQGTVVSSVNELGSSYETSNELVNKLWENITWSMRGNFLSIPTDTPARNERMGWGGDISVFSRTASYMANVNQFLKQHMLAMRDMQREDGRFPDIAPVGDVRYPEDQLDSIAVGGALWGSAGITVPWEAYQQYGDVNLLSEHYEGIY